MESVNCASTSTASFSPYTIAEATPSPMCASELMNTLTSSGSAASAAKPQGVIARQHANARNDENRTGPDDM